MLWTIHCHIRSLVTLWNYNYVHMYQSRITLSDLYTTSWYGLIYVTHHDSDLYIHAYHHIIDILPCYLSQIEANVATWSLVVMGMRRCVHFWSFESLKCCQSWAQWAKYTVIYAALSLMELWFHIRSKDPCEIWNFWLECLTAHIRFPYEVNILFVLCIFYQTCCVLLTKDLARVFSASKHCFVVLVDYTPSVTCHLFKR